MRTRSAGGKRIAMFLVPADPPHLRPQKRSGLFLVPPGDVEQIVRQPGIVPGSRADPQTRRARARAIATRLSQAAARSQGTMFALRNQLPLRRGAHYRRYVRSCHAEVGAAGTVHNQVVCVWSDSAGASAFLMMPGGPMDRDGAGEHVVWLPGGLVLVRDDFRARV